MKKNIKRAYTALGIAFIIFNGHFNFAIFYIIATADDRITFCTGVALVTFIAFITFFALDALVAF